MSLQNFGKFSYSRKAVSLIYILETHKFLSYLDCISRVFLEEIYVS